MVTPGLRRVGDGSVKRDLEAGEIAFEATRSVCPCFPKLTL